MRSTALWLTVCAALTYAGCGSSGSKGASGGAGQTGTAGGGSAGSSGMTGSGSSGTNGSGAAGQTQTGQAGNPGIVMCTPGKTEALITDCGYPMMGAGQLAAITFSEDEVLRAIQPVGGAPMGIVRMFYNDEHALTMGVRQVVVKTAAGTTMMDYPVAPLVNNPDMVTDPKTGTNELIGDQSGLDQSLRPMWPVLYITDITKDPMSRAGDWQMGGVPVGPSAVFGTWKAAVRTVDKTVTPNTVTITPDKDPTKNAWNLGAGADPVPAGLTSQGWGAEVRWTVPLTPGHSFRVQVLVHDGDQNKAGGDSGEACVLFCAGGAGGEGGNDDGGTPPPAMCPAGTEPCGGGIDPLTCASGTVCANGCCLPIIP